MSRFFSGAGYSERFVALGTIVSLLSTVSEQMSLQISRSTKCFFAFSALVSLLSSMSHQMTFQISSLAE